MYSDSNRGFEAYGRDRAGRWHAFPQASAPAAVARFDQRREQLVNLDLAPIGSPASVLLALVLLDSVLQRDDLRGAWQAMVRPLTWRGRACITWSTADGTSQRRFLSAFTRLAANAITWWPSFDEAARTASGIVRRPSASAIEVCAIDGLLQDGAAWAHVSLPPYIAFSITGICPMACLPLSTLARESARAALAPAEAEEGSAIRHSGNEGTDSEYGALWRAMDAALVCGQGTELRQRRTTVRNLRAIVSMFPSLTDGELLVLTWCIHLIEVGTPTTSQIAPATGADYIRRIGPGLLARIDAVLAELETPTRWVVMYTELIEEADEGSRHKAHAALSAFHEFAVAQLDAPQLKSITDAGIDVDRPPRANVLWPHEAVWISEQLQREHLSSEARFLKQMRVLFGLLLETGARSSDIFALRMDGVRAWTDSMILSIDPRPSDGSLKTTGSRRQVRIVGSALIALINGWVAFRVAEGAGDADLLLGYPDGTHRVWRRARSLLFLGDLMKAATGDSFIGAHALRHTKVTDVAGSVPHTPEGERTFHSLAAGLGHGADVSTRRDYDHSSDVVLMRALDELNRKVAVTWVAAAQWLSASDVALRKRASRSTLDRQSFIATELANAVGALTVHDVSSQFKFNERSAPSLRCEAAGSQFTAVLGAIGDLAGGSDIVSTALRNGLEPRLVRQIALRILSEAGMPHALDESEPRFRFRIGEALDRLSRIADFGRLVQPKYAPLVELSRRASASRTLLLASLSWESIRRGRYLSLEEPEHAFELLQFLASAGVVVEQLVICVSGDGEDCKAVGMQHAIVARIDSVFHRPPLLQRCTERRGRPRAYLLFKDRDVIGNSPAASSVTGLQALMLAASIWRHLLDGAV